MNAKITGRGKQTLVLSHGYGGSQHVWDDIIPILEDKYRVVVFDWNFSGDIDDQPVPFDAFKYSSFAAFSDDLISLLDHMNLHSSVFIGHSMAGMIGCIASIKRPDLFRQLILIGSSPRYLNGEDYEGGFDKDAIESMLSAIESNFKTWAPAFASLVVGDKDPVSVEKFTRTLQRMRPEVALSLARTVFLSDLRDVLENVEVPCSIIQCSNDVVVPVSVARYMERKIKGQASVEIIDTHGHFPQLTAHEKLLETIHRLLNITSNS